MLVLCSVYAIMLVSEIFEYLGSWLKVPTEINGFLLSIDASLYQKTNQSGTNGPFNAHLTIAQVMPRYNHNNEKQEALL